MMPRHHKTLAALALALAAALHLPGARAAEAPYALPERKPDTGYTTFAIPRAGTTPTLDGVIDTAEWAGATMFNAMGDQQKPPSWSHLYPRWVTWWMMWDDDNLYLASRSQRLKNESLAVRYRDESRGGNTVFDDSVEIHFNPYGRNTPGGALPWAAQAIINPLGVGYYSKFIWSVAARTSAWRPGWKMGSKIHADFWEIEIAIPRQSLDLEQPNAVGDLWSVLLCRNWKRTGWNQSAVPCSLSEFQMPTDQPIVVLHDGAFARLEDVAGLFEGRLHTQLALGNSGKQPAKISATLRVTEDKAAVAAFEETRTFVIAPGQSDRWRIDRPGVLADGKTYVYHLLATAEGMNRPLLETQFRVVPGSQAWLAEQAAAMKPQEYQFAVELAPTTFKLNVFADFLYAQEKARITQLQVKVAKDGKPVFEGSSNNIQHDGITAMLDLPELTPGTYDWTLALQDANGKEVVSRKGQIVKRDEAAAFPWWNYDGGRADRVLWPYEAVSVEGAIARYWGGEYTLDGLGLPRQLVVTANREWRPALLEDRPSVLSRGLRFSAGQKGKAVKVGFAQVPRTMAVKDWEAVFEGFGQVGEDVEIQSRATLGQDGLLWVELTLRPGLDASSGRDVRRKSASLDRLTLDIPLRESVATHMIARSEGGNTGTHHIGAVPLGEGVVFESKGFGQGELLYGNAMPMVWLGNDHRGLTVLLENNRGWVHAGESDQQILRENGEVVLRLNLIQKQVELTGERTISFGLLPTPMRRMVSGWRMLNCSAAQNFVNWFGLGIVASPGAYHNASVIPASYQKSRQALFLTPHSRLTRLGGFELAPHTEQGTYDTRTTDRDARAYFGPEWAQNTWTPSFQNHIFWYMQRYIREGGLTGIYHDQYYPNAVHNTITGAAWELPDGRVNCGYNMRKDRQFLMREHALFDEHNIRPRIFVHATNSGQMIGYPWATAVLDGEDKRIPPGADFDWIDLHPADRLQAHGNPWPFGNTFYWMRLIGSGEPAWRERQDRAFIGWQLAHDVIDANEGFGPEKIRRAMFEWGMNDDRVRFWPYWRNQSVVHVSHDDVKVSLWTLPDRALLVAVNLDKKATRTTTIRLPLQDLGLMPEVRSGYLGASDLYGEGGVTFNAWDGEVEVAIKPRDYRVISIRKY
jgi:hypothetical protein